MKSIEVMICCAALLWACGETEDGLRNLNSPPLINFNNAVGQLVLEDSIKVGIKTGQERYLVELNVFDENDNLTQVEYTQEFGRGTLLQGGDTIRGNDIAVASDVLRFEYYPLDIGSHRFSIRATDRFDESSSVIIALEAFTNLPPVARFTFARDGQFGTRQWVINAEESFDRDSRFGGAIVEYEYSVLGRVDNIFVPSEPSPGFDPTRYQAIFPQDGTYTIGVRVRDNDGVWSQRFERDVRID